jgi:hypothetical protein
MTHETCLVLTPTPNITIMYRFVSMLLEPSLETEKPRRWLGGNRSSVPKRQTLTRQGINRSHLLVVLVVLVLF